MVAMAKDTPGKGKKKAPKPPTMSLLEVEHLQRDIRRLVPSDNWYGECISAVQSGIVKKKDDIGAQLKKSGVFPPGPNRFDRSPVHQPMLPCKSRACCLWVYNRRTERKDNVVRKFPFYFRRGKLVPNQFFLVEGRINGEDGEREYGAPTQRDAVLKARKDFDLIEKVTPNNHRRRSIPMCDECRWALAHARQEREARREERASTEVVEVDYSGNPVVDEPEVSPTVAAMEKIKFYGERPMESQLPTENTEKLKKQIERYLANQKTGLVKNE